jgi:hypothetical protein
MLREKIIGHKRELKSNLLGKLREKKIGHKRKLNIIYLVS